MFPNPLRWLRAAIFSLAFSSIVEAREPSIKPPPAANNPDIFTKDRVGKIGLNRYYTPANQILTPAGIQVELPGIRPPPK